MLNITEHKVQTILSPTGINLASHVINPYQGCEMGCLFCYAQFSKVAKTQSQPWGTYVKVKINAREVLERQLKTNNVKKVLIGSTTEPFQSVEKKYRITQSIIELLNARNIRYVIMTRALLVEEYSSIIKKELCAGIYFTIDVLPQALRQKFHPHAPSVDRSIAAVERLSSRGIKTSAYFCPIMPFLCRDLQKACKMQGVKQAEFEMLNFQMSGIGGIIKTINDFSPRIAEEYKRMCQNGLYYQRIMHKIKKHIQGLARKHFSKSKIHSHAYQEYFKNRYEFL